VKLVARIDGQPIPVEVERLGDGYRVRVGEVWHSATLASPNDSLRSLRLDDGTQFLIVHHGDRARHELLFGAVRVQLEVRDPLAERRRTVREDVAGTDDVIRAVMPGRIVRVLVTEGETVTKGTGLVVVEAMKMENELAAPRDGTVARVHVGAGETVESGAELVELE